MRQLFCSYCKRALDRVGINSDRSATRDHVEPESRGGKIWVWCCRYCNTMKSNLSASEWHRVTEIVTQWWLPENKKTLKAAIKTVRSVSELQQMICDWPWLRELVNERIGQVGFGPWASK